MNNVETDNNDSNNNVALVHSQNKGSQHTASASLCDLSLSEFDRLHVPIAGT